MSFGHARNSVEFTQKMLLFRGNIGQFADLCVIREGNAEFLVW